MRLAPAKINLALHVTGRRDDGLHLLDTIAVFAGLGDRLAVAPAGEVSLSVSGPLASHAPPGETNLALRAARRLAEALATAAGAALTLEKHLPAGAGFGGGSADAAAALLALNDLWAGGLDRASLAALGLELGADVPICVHGRVLRARGVGERVEPIAGWPALPLVLVWPGVHVSTGAVFSALDSRVNPPLEAAPAGGSVEEVAGWLARQRNDLEAPALKAAPVIGQALATIAAVEGCLLARMSGSGSGCFGLFATEELSHAAAERLAADQPGWWVRATLAR